MYRPGNVQPDAEPGFFTGPDSVVPWHSNYELVARTTQEAGNNVFHASSTSENGAERPPTTHSEEHEDEVPEMVPVPVRVLEQPRPGLQQRSSSRKMTDAELFQTLTRRMTSGSSSGLEQQRPPLQPRSSTRNRSRAEMLQTLTRRMTSKSTNTRGGQSNANNAGNTDNEEEMAEIHRLLEKMFGDARRKHSEEERTRHFGLVWKNLTVKGVGLGAAVQSSIGNPFYFWKTIFTKGPKAAKQKPPVRTLIDDFSGCIKPGEMVLVLGRPGSGCSTFLKTLANQRSGFQEVSGVVTYGGTDWKMMGKKYRSEILYNPEEDLHYAQLTVKDTLSFALKTRTPGKESREEGESKNDYVKEFLRMVVKLFWIEHTMGTRVGNELIRGVSGGERKRVSIAEAMITKASTQCWDNSTMGLDASTAREYVESLRVLTDMTHISTAAALYQVGESLYDLFDKVILIHGGKCAYFGPADTAADYFKDLGFVQPDRWTTADFLTSVTDEHERHIRPGHEDKIPRSAEQFGDAFRNSKQAQCNVEEVEEFEKETKQLIEERHKNQGKATKKKNYTISFPQQVWACTNRQARVMLGDPQSLYGKWAIVTWQSLIVGSLFYNLQPTSSGVFPRGGVMFFMLLFNSLLALAELTSAFQSRPILLKHRTFSFYRPAAYAIAQTVIDIPLVFVQVLIFDLVVYFMAHLQRTASQFFISLLILWLVTMTMYGFFRSVGAILPSLDVATRITGVALQAIIVYTGYLLPTSKMHPWFSWLRWINPLQYAFESLMSNEFYNLEIRCEPPFLVPQGPRATEQYQGCTLQGSTPGSNTVNGANYIMTEYNYTRAHLWRNIGILCAFFIFFSALTALGLESQKPNKGGGALTVFKRDEAPHFVQKAMEKGSTPHDEENGSSDVGDATTEVDSSENDDAVNGKTVAKNETIFTWQGVNYIIPYEGGSRTLLRDQQGYVRPGKLTALMGASGAGKTTLLNVLAQRVTFGVIEGEFLVDGKALPKSFQRSSGFAEQMDIHEPTASVREALRFSAQLRQPRDVPLEEKYDYVERVIDLLEMRDIAGATIGNVGEGLNQEQRKRLTIGVELASKPELLMFLDEPTSGLDSGAAFNIVRLLKKLAAAGQAILCTIHQPSSILFEHFDELVLLEAGGRIVYHGELGHDSRTLLGYLESNGARKCPPKSNPAEFMLEAIGAGNPDYDGQDWGDVWQDSEEKQTRSKEIQEMIQDRRGARRGDHTTDDREFAMPWSTQVRAVVARRFVAYWRTPNYIVGKFMLHIVTGLFNTFTFYKLGNSSIDMQSRLFSIFLTLTIAPPLIQQLQPKFLEFRALYKSREANSKIYSWSAFVIAAIAVEVPYSLVAGTLYFCCWYWGVNFPRDTYTSAVVWCWIMVFELFYVGFGQAIASFSPNAILASLLVPVFFTFVVSFCGVLVPAMSLPYFWRSWMYLLTPFHYLLEGLLGLVTHNVPVRCQLKELAQFNHPPGLTCESYAGAFASQAGGYVETLSTGLCGYCQYTTGDDFAASFSVYYKHLWRDFGLFWAYILFNFAVVFVCSWLYLEGGRKIVSRFSPKARKQRKAAERKEEEMEGSQRGEKGTQ